MVPTSDFSTAINQLSLDQQVWHRAGRLALPKLIGKGAIGLELGVATGYFSNALLSAAELSRLYSIDAWSDHHDSNEYLGCASLLAKHGNRSVIMRMFFEDALIHFPDDFFDFIYVDAYAHTGQQEGKLFTEWYPKLKVGGVFSGHDYDPVAWPQTVAAVDRFVGSIGKQIQVIDGVKTEFNEDIYASWYFIK
jgi:predicted O-methyltransferase YrrM